MQVPETTALLAVIADLLVDDEDSQVRCRQAVAERGDALPTWLVELQRVEVYRAVRMTHVLGDRDELLIGARFADGQELTCVAVIDHNMVSEVKDAFFVPDSIDEVLAATAERSRRHRRRRHESRRCRAWICHGLEQFLPTLDSVQWPHCRPLVQWLIGRLPQGGTAPITGRGLEDDLCVGRQVLRDLLQPCRSQIRPSRAVAGTSGHRHGRPIAVERGSRRAGVDWIAVLDDHIPLEVALDAPDLLRAFIPYAHAQSGIRDELTAGTLAMVDALRSSYKREVLRQAKFWDLDDAV